MLLIYVDEITERLTYTLDFICKDRGILYSLTNDWKYFDMYDQLKFVYSEKSDHSFLQLIPSTLLFDEAIFPYAVGKKRFFNEEVLTLNRIADPLASIFYILSRYEEYNTKQRDQHDRFEAKNSVLYKNKWLNKVMCDRWAEDFIAFLEERLLHKLPKQKIGTRIIPSFDIDNTFAFQWKEGIRRLLGSLKDRLNKDFLRIEARKAFETGVNKDPYDTFDIIKSLKNQGFDVQVFWLLGEYSKFDKNISPNDGRHQALIREMSKYAKVGLHPSYKSNMSFHLLKNELELLQKILGQDIRSSRQHFLKLTLPSTYRGLIALGFTDDYSMGFADEIGFRAGTSRPFRFFDLMQNITTDFWIHPFAYMDGTLNQYMKLSPQKAKQEINCLFQEVKNYGGDFIFLWHNETISEFGIWEGWKTVFEYTLNLRNEI